MDSHNCAFLVPEKDLDAIFERIQRVGITYCADPALKKPRQINHNDGGHGVYFLVLEAVEPGDVSTRAVQRQATFAPSGRMPPGDGRSNSVTRTATGFELARHRAELPSIPV